MSDYPVETSSVPKKTPFGFAWPSKGDRLLRTEQTWETGVRFVDHEIARHVHIWDGYMRAGAALIDQCEREPLDRIDLVYPILFCYRHGLELAMKWIIAQYGRYAELSPAEFLHHDLLKLWMGCKKTVLAVGSDGETCALQAVEQIVKDFHELDRGSFAFRYSTDTNGAIIRLPNAAFDLANIKRVMEAVNNLFIGVDGQLDHNVSSVDYY